MGELNIKFQVVNPSCFHKIYCVQCAHQVPRIIHTRYWPVIPVNVYTTISKYKLVNECINFLKGALSLDTIIINYHVIDTNMKVCYLFVTVYH